MGRELTDRALLGEMFTLWGPHMATSMLGVAAAAAILGAYDRESFLAMPFGSRASRYRWLTEMYRLREHLEAAGYDTRSGTVDEAVAPLLGISRAGT